MLASSVSVPFAPGSALFPSSTPLYESVDDAFDAPGAQLASFVSTHPLNLSGRAVLLAVGGSAGADGAAHVALALAKSRNARIHVVHVQEDVASPTWTSHLHPRSARDAVAPSTVSIEQLLGIQASLSITLSCAVEWPVRVMCGTPAAAIAHEAGRIGAVLIILGLSKHGRVHRPLHDDTALTVMRHAVCPVMAVVPEISELPTRVLAAVDFSETSLLAARAAATVTRDQGLLVLAYVAPPTGLARNDGESTVHELGVQAGFADAAEMLKRGGITLDHVVLHQELPRSPAERLMEYAYATRTDLIAAGSVRRENGDRATLGSVSTDLVRDGKQSLLIVPPRAGSVPL